MSWENNLAVRSAIWGYLGGLWGSHLGTDLGSQVTLQDSASCNCCGPTLFLAAILLRILRRVPSAHRVETTRENPSRKNIRATLAASLKLQVPTGWRPLSTSRSTIRPCWRDTHRKRSQCTLITFWASEGLHYHRKTREREVRVLESF